MKLVDLKCNYLKTPKGINTPPVFSWKLNSTEKEVVQTAYQLVVVQDNKILFDSGKVDSAQSVDVNTELYVIDGGKIYTWRVTVWSNKGDSDCAESYFESGIDHWEAKWIKVGILDAQYTDPKDESLIPAITFRKKFNIIKNVKNARMYVTSHGVYSIRMNGDTPDDRLLAPEFTSYQGLLCYQIYDVTDMLKIGVNICNLEVADGWWSGRIGMTGECGQYGLSRAVIFQINITYTDGTTEIIVTDENVQCTSDGTIRYSDLFIGEKQDHRYLDDEIKWDQPVNNKAKWHPVIVVDYDNSILQPQTGGYIKKIKEVTPIAIIKTPKGEQLIDFGQVIAGFVNVTTYENEGTEISLEHSEVLDEEGNYLNNIMGGHKDQKDIFICSGHGKEVFEPKYTFHGFRYVKVTGISDLKLENFKAYAISNDLEELATFKCSNEKINKLYSNTRWSQYANMISIPTDCPQREKAGWAGDIQVYSPTAAFHQDMDSFLNRWLDSLAIDQYEDGQVPNVIPYNNSYKMLLGRVFGSDCSAGWGDACIIVPYVMYQKYGDQGILKKNYPIMKKWMDYTISRAENYVPESFNPQNATEREIDNQKYLWNTDWHFGDWMIPSISKGPRGGVDGAVLTKELVASIYYGYANRLMKEISILLGNKKEAKEYDKRHKRNVEAIKETYVGEDGVLSADFQGCYVLALWHEVIPEAQITKALNRLEKLIDENNGCLDTGFLATPILLDVFTKYNKLDRAYQLLYQEECPSWLYEINKGATSIWESWDGIQPDGKVGCLSYNHYAFGCVMDWIYRVMAGINGIAPGYQTMVIQPRPDASMKWMACSHESVYGKISSAWKQTDTEFTLVVEIPCNTTAEIILPDGTMYKVGSGKYQYSCKLQ